MKMSYFERGDGMKFYDRLKTQALTENACVIF